MPRLHNPSVSARPASWSPLERRLRATSRRSLYYSLLLAALGAWLGVRFVARQSQPRVDQPWVGQNYAALPEVQLLQAYVRVDTSQPDADELSGALFLEEQLRRAGVASTLERLPGRKANLWAVLDGELPEAVVLHQHIDTDPVRDPAAWLHPPFEGVIDPSQIWGRGVFDMKGVGIAQLRAFLAVAASGQRPRRSLILLATGSEEIDSKLGMRRFLANEPELAARFWVFLTEGGTVEALNTEELKYWGTEFAQRRVVDLYFSGSRASLEQLRSRLIARPHETRPRLVPETEAFLAAYAPTRGIEKFRGLLADPVALVADARLFSQLPYYLRSVFVDRAVAGSIREATGDRSELIVRLLLLPRAPFAPTLAELYPEALWSDLDVSLRVEEAHPPAPGSPLDHPAYLEIQRLLERRVGQLRGPTRVGPVLLTHSATDARFVRARGVAAYGFSPFLASSTESLMIGESNERLSLPGFVAGVEIYEDLVRRLCL